MKSNRKPGRTRSSPSTYPTADFKLEDWHGPRREFRFIGWRDDYSAFFVLDEKDGQFVIQPELFRPESPIRFREAPASITKIRLLPPPCRPTRAEADLLREMRQLAEGRGRGYHDAVAIYRAEASKRNILHPTVPDPWELIYEDALAPKDAPDPKKNQQAIQEELWNAWAASHGLTLESMVNNRTEFTRRHGVDDLASLARVSYRMEFKNFAAVWLVGYHGPQAPQSTADLDQIRKLLDARPELVRITPEQAETELGLAHDARHRILKDYCAAAKMDWNDLTRANLPALTAVRNDRKDAQSRAAQRLNKKRRKNC
jgi:hypothetical protein